MRAFRIEVIDFTISDSANIDPATERRRKQQRVEPSGCGRQEMRRGERDSSQENLGGLLTPVVKI